MRPTLLLLILVLSSCADLTTDRLELEGVIGKDIGLTADLRVYENSVVGTYFYHKYQNTVQVSGERRGDSLFFTGSYQGRMIDRFKGELQSDGSLSGMWYKPDGSRHQPFYLTRGSFHYREKGKGYSNKNSSSEILSKLSLAGAVLFICFLAVAHYESNRKHRRGDQFTRQSGELNFLNTRYSPKRKYSRQHRSKDARKLIPSVTSPEQQWNTELSAAEKGEQFEKFVVELFPGKFYDLHRWRSDKRHNGRSPLDSRDPDLEFKRKHGNPNCTLHFAVECKWRQAIAPYKGVVSIDSEEKMEHYTSYQQRTGNPTFMVIGEGGDPHLPKTVYCIPIDAFQGASIDYKNFVSFKRHNPHKPFFYTECEQTLN